MDAVTPVWGELGGILRGVDEGIGRGDCLGTVDSSREEGGMASVSEKSLSSPLANKLVEGSCL